MHRWERIATRYVRPLWASFVDGMATIYRSPRRLVLTFSTIGIWVLYVLMAYVPLEMFGLSSLYDPSGLDATVIMFVDVLGVIVPTPGGAGSYHYVTILALTAFYGVPASAAVTYAVFASIAYKLTANSRGSKTDGAPVVAARIRSTVQQVALRRNAMGAPLRTAKPHRMAQRLVQMPRIR